MKVTYEDSWTLMKKLKRLGETAGNCMAAAGRIGVNAWLETGKMKNG